MAHASLRFVHAAHLRLDSPLTGTGPLSGTGRRIAEDATLIAWQRTVDACLEQSVDFLLLTGELLHPDCTRRARRAFGEGCEALAEFEIPVFVACGFEESERWFPAGEWPGNVRAVTDLQSQTWERAGAVAARLEAVGRIDEALSASSTGDSGSRPVRILCPLATDIGCEGEYCKQLTSEEHRGPQDAASQADRLDSVYIALSDPEQRTSSDPWQTIHFPGVMQPLSAVERGPQGCSLVEFTEDGRVELTRIPTAPVGWEHFTLDIDCEIGRAELIERMQLALLDREPGVGEQLWLVHWVFAGAGDVFDEFVDERAFSRLAAEVESGIGHGGPERVHLRETRSVPHGDDAFVQKLLDSLSEAGNHGSFMQQLAGRLSAGRFTEAAALVATLPTATARESAARSLQQWSEGRKAG